MNRDYFISPHQSRYDARVFGKAGRIEPMVSPSILARLFGRLPKSAPSPVMNQVTLRCLGAPRDCHLAEEGE
jgi:hypothetical protein